MTFSLPPVDANDSVRRAFDEIEAQWAAESTYRGHGDPTGVVTAGPGAQYIDVDTGKLWIHEATTSSSAGWAVK
jgi:hypothetical protein